MQQSEWNEYYNGKKSLIGRAKNDFADEPQRTTKLDRTEQEFECSNHLNGNKSFLDRAKEKLYMSLDIENCNDNSPAADTNDGKANFFCRTSGGMFDFTQEDEVGIAPSLSRSLRTKAAAIFDGHASLFDGNGSLFEAVEEELDIGYNVHDFTPTKGEMIIDWNEEDSYDDHENDINLLETAKSMGIALNSMFRRCSDPTDYSKTSPRKVSDKELKCLKDELQKRGCITNVHAKEVIRQKYCKRTGPEKKPIIQAKLSFLIKKSENMVPEQKCIFENHENFFTHSTKAATQKPILRRASMCSNNVSYVQAQVQSNDVFEMKQADMQEKLQSQPQYNKVESVQLLNENFVR